MSSTSSRSVWTYRQHRWSDSTLNHWRQGPIYSLIILTTLVEKGCLKNRVYCWLSEAKKWNAMKRRSRKEDFLKNCGEGNELSMETYTFEDSQHLKRVVCCLCRLICVIGKSRRLPQRHRAAHQILIHPPPCGSLPLLDHDPDRRSKSSESAGRFETGLTDGGRIWFGLGRRDRDVWACLFVRKWFVVSKRIRPRVLLEAWSSSVMHVLWCVFSFSWSSQK